MKRENQVLSRSLLVVLLGGTLCLFVSLRTAGRTATQMTKPAASVESQASIQTLEPGKPIERELAGGQAHDYQIALQKEQYLHVVVEQKGIDVVVTLFGPDGKQLVEMDSPNGAQGPEPIDWIAKQTGSYRLEVRSSDHKVKAARYEIKIHDLRQATEKDVKRIAVQQQLLEATRLGTEVGRLYEAGKYDDALPLAIRTLRIREKILGSDHSDVASALSNLALLYKKKAKYLKAAQLYKRALAIYEKALGPDDIGITASLNNLAILHKVKGEYAKARQLYERTLSIQERVLGPVHPRVAITLNNIALLRQKEGEYEESGALLERVRSIDEKEYGPIHPTVATDLNNLGLNYLAKGEYAKAESLIRSGLDIREKAFGPNHPDVAQSVANYAAIYYERGDYDRAEPLYMRALKIDETVFGDNSTEVANDLNNLAALYVAKGEYTKAEQRYNRALAINEKALGPDHPTVAQFLNNLAEIYEIRGNYSKAERLYMRALAIRRRTQPRGHPDIAQSLNNLAVLFHKKRDYLKAEALHRRALVIYQRALGPNHTLVANSLNHLASVCRAEGRMTNAITYQIAANQVREYSVDHNLVLGSERQKLLFLRLSETEEDNTISLHIQAAPDNHSACQMALTTVLRRKGRGLEAMSDSLGHVRKTLQPQDQAFLNRLIDARTLLATVTLNGPGQSNVADYRARLQQLEESVDGLEGDLSARSTEFRIQHQPISLEIVQKAIPQGAVLVEFALYRNYNAKADSYGPARYVAYTLAARGEPQWADLGEAVPIEKTIELLRVALSDPKRSDVKELARELDSKTMQPVRKLIGPNRWLLISPDGALNLVPLSSLVDENGQYLIENYFFTYLTSGRDLLRLQVPIAAKQGPLLVANPDFGGQGPGVGGKKLTQVTKAPLEQAQTHLFSQFYFPPLPATAEEGEALRLILPNATLLTKRQATKAALKQVDGPIILHIATHGFFLENLEAGSLDARAIELASTDPARLLLQQGAAGPGGWRVENPLLRSGLALAGANEHKSDDDGIMTALEVSGLSLWGTKLVVLSACDSGVGEVKNGDGVYGLRRALVLAGSESQIMSLWSVNDAATRDLMIDYYKGLQAGQGRSEALRNVQLKMLKDPKRSHPAYWASFIQSGQWKNLDGKE